MFLITDAFKMIAEIRRTGWQMNLWGGALNIPQAIGGLIFIQTMEGAVILFCAILTLMVAGQIHKRARFSRIIAICHLPWLVMLPWLIHRLLSTEHSIFLQIWGWYVAVVVAVSLIFDALDLWRYAKGDRLYAWSD